MFNLEELFIRFDAIDLIEVDGHSAYMHMRSGGTIKGLTGSLEDARELAQAICDKDLVTIKSINAKALILNR